MNFNIHQNDNRHNNPYFSNPEFKHSDLFVTISDPSKINEGFKKHLYKVITQQPKSAFSQTLIGKAVIWAGKQLTAAIKILFPSRVDLIDKKVAIFNTALSSRAKPTEISRSLGDKIGHDEREEILNTWLHTYLKEAGNEEPLNKLCQLMYELADGDVSDDVRKKMKEEIRTIIENKQIKRQFPQLSSGISYFIQVFDEEKKFEDALAPSATNQYLQTLLAHPNLLKQKEVVNIVNQMPISSLRQKVIEKMDKVSMRMMNKAHAQERELLNALPLLLKKLSFDELKDKYTSDAEKNYLEARLEVVEKKIDEIQTQLGTKENFNLRILKFEQAHLNKQIAAMEKAQSVLDTIGTIPVNSHAGTIPPTINNANIISSGEIKKVRALFSKRTDDSLTFISQSIQKLSNQKVRDKLEADFKALSDEYKQLKELNDEEFLAQSSVMTKKIQHLETFMLMHLPNRSEYLSHVNDLMKEYATIKTHLDDLHRLGTPWKELNEIQTTKERRLERQDGLVTDVIRLSLEKKSTCQLPLKLSEMDARTFGTTKQATEEKSALNVALKKHAAEFMQSIQSKHHAFIKAQLFSLREYTSDVSDANAFPELQLVEDEIENVENNPFNFEQYADSMDISEELKKWHADLQQVWVEHIPREQEKTILAISNKEERLQKMEECFAAWLQEKTNTKLSVPLSFEGIKIQDLSAIRKKEIKKLGTIVSHYREKLPANKLFAREQIADIHDRAKTGLIKLSLTKLSKGKLSSAELSKVELYQAIIKNERLTPDQLAQAKRDKDLFPNISSISKPTVNEISASLIEQKTPTFTQVLSLNSIDFQNPNTGKISNANPVKALQDARKKIFGVPPQPTNVEKRCEWIKELAQNPEIQSLTDLRLTIIGECSALVQASFDKHVAVPQEIHQIFLNQYRIGNQIIPPLDFSNLNNVELKTFLDTYVRMTFSSGQTYNLTSQQRYFLVQFCALSGLPDEQIETILKMTTNHNSPSTLPMSDVFTEVGKKLQSTLIGMEGIEESALQKSFQKSTLPHTPETRKLLDFWRARSGQALLPGLFKYSVDIHDKSHDQGRSAIERAITQAFKTDPKKGVEYLRKALEDPIIKSDAFNPQTLASPLRIFYLDCLLKCDPNDAEAIQEIQDFNEVLIKSKNINQMVLGFSREITRLSQDLSTGKITDQDFAKLLKYKLAYQQLKFNHFHNKVEIKGFLKAATEAADVAMISTTNETYKKLATAGFLKTIKPLLLENIFKEERYADKLIKDVFKDREDLPFENDPHIPGYVSLGDKVEIDTVLGVIYYEGSQKVTLPAHLQNHPDMRTLGIHTLPYTQDASGAPFIYYTTLNGEKTPQIIVTEKYGQPIIHKKLRIDFASTGKSKTLQFVPKERLNLPYAITHRMDIKNFWSDSDRTVYGFDSQGELAVIINKKWEKDAKNNPIEKWSIKVKEGNEYSPLTDHSIKEQQSHPALRRLLACYNPNEILVDWKTESFLIPALGLTITKTNEGEKEAIWKCECKGITGKILDTDSPPTSYLSLKNETNQNKIAKLTKDFELAKKQLEKKKAYGLSRVRKHEIHQLEREISHLENSLKDAHGRILLTTLPQQSFAESKTVLNHLIEDVIPSNYKGAFKEYATKTQEQNYLKNNIQYHFQIYPFTLQFLEGKMNECHKLLQKNNSQEIQDNYTALQEAYKIVQKENEHICEQPAEIAIFINLGDGLLASKDFSGSLALILNGKGDPVKLLKELAKYPLTQPLNDSQLSLLKKASKLVQDKISTSTSDLKEKMIQLDIYLNLLEYQHLSYQMEELAHSTLSDKMNESKSISDAFAKKEAQCNKILNDLSEVSPEILALWKKTTLAPIKLASHIQHQPKAVSINQAGKPIVDQELTYLTQESLLERFFSTDKITGTPKDLQVELSSQHKSLIKSFQTHSAEQVAGFYLEEMGRFDLNGLYSEFRINDKGVGLYGINKEDIDTLFDFLKKEQYIIQKGQENYYSLTSAEHATRLFQKDQIRALLADRPLSEEQIQKMTGRLQPFLVKAMQSGFNFSFKDKQVESELKQKLQLEKDNHLQKYLDAEESIKAKLEPYGIPLVELKYAVLSGDYRSIINKESKDGFPFPAKELPVLRNALTRYLFHKTEIQHINNTLKAPSLGERNMIELLQTKRNYSVDKLLQEGLTGKEREEQIIQRAFLVFEEDYGFRCNAMQIKMFHSLLLDSNQDEAIDAAQARMGFGKTALLPIMAIVRVAIEREREMEERHLVRYIVPRAVIEDNTSSFNQRLSAITGGHVIKDRDFTRYQIDKEDPDLSFDFILSDLNRRLAFYKEARNQGDVLIQWPEIRGSMEAQELDFGEMIIQGNLSVELEDKCIQCKRLLGEIRSISTYSIFDELDDTQDIKSREVNYTRGEKSPISIASIRPMEKLIAFIDKQEDWKDSYTVAKKMLQEIAGFDPKEITPELLNYMTDRNCELDADLKQFLSEPLRNYLNGSGTSNIHTERDSALFLIRAILLDPNMLALAKSKQPNTHFGARFIEREGKRVYFNDPDSQSPLLIAVPYEGTNTPKGLSIFDNTEVAGITTMRYYLSKETLFSESPHLDFLIKQVRRNTIPPELSNHYLDQMVNKEGQKPIDQLKEIAGLLDAEELKQAKEKFYNDFMKNPSEDFRKFFGVAVVATQIRSDAASAKSDRYEKGSPNNVEKGCSGTVGGTSSYFAKQETDAAADGKLSLEIMGRANNAAVIELTPPQVNQDYLSQILTTILSQSNANTRAIVDAAGMCKSRDGTPESVVAMLWNHLQSNEKIKGIEGIVYYGKDNIKRLYRGPNLPSIPCSTAMELAALDGKKYFSFYGQKNTRGSDIKQANGAHAIVTMDENVLNSDAKQAVLRFRNLVNRNSGQTFSFAFMPNFTKILRDTLKVDITQKLDKVKGEQVIQENQLEDLKYSLNTAPINQRADIQKKIKETEDVITALKTQITALQTRLNDVGSLSIETKEVSNYLRFQEKELEQKEALAIFRKEMSAHIKQAASHLEQEILAQLPTPLDAAQKAAYVNFLKNRNDISAFVERSIDNLHDKYGAATTDQSRDAFIDAQKIITTKKLSDLFLEARKFATEVKCSVNLKESFYDEHIDRSVAFFKERFDENTPVQVTTVNVGAMAIAQALAEAFAQAEAEGLAEKLSENVIEVLDRFVPPHLETTHEHHDEISLDFIKNSKLRHPITDFAPCQKLIKANLRDQFQVSDFLFKNQNMVSHFILAKKGAPYVFIAQEEADLFKRSFDAKNDMQGYTLYDAREISSLDDKTKLIHFSNKEVAKQIGCAILGDNDVPEDHISQTAILRTTQLTNVDSDQLLPHLRIQTNTEDLNENYVDLTQFGLSTPATMNLAIAPNNANQIEIRVGGDGFSDSITIPKGNKYLNQYINEVYNEDVQGKMIEVQNRVKKEYGAIAGKLIELEEQQQLLAAKKVELNKILCNPEMGNFDANYSMIQGLTQRDSEFASRDFSQSKYGAKFLGGLKQIKESRANLTNAPSSANVKKLKDAFNAFINPNTLAQVNLSNYSSTALFTSAEWYKHLNNPSASKMSPLELVYGRILYSVHQGNIAEAKGCTRQDCFCMFSKTLPDLIKSVKELTHAINEIELIEKQSQEIEDEIIKINGMIPQDLLEADQTLKDILAKQTLIETQLAKQGIQFAGKNELLDRFHFSGLQKWNKEIKATVHGFLPEYKAIVKEGMENGFLKAITAPTEEEQQVLQDNNRFLKNVLTLSGQVEARAREVMIEVDTKSEAGHLATQ